MNNLNGTDWAILGEREILATDSRENPKFYRFLMSTEQTESGF